MNASHDSAPLANALPEDAASGDDDAPAGAPSPTARPSDVATPADASDQSLPNSPNGAPRPREIGGQAGPEPTRYGDWEKKGRCTDF